MPPRLRIEGRDAHQPVHASLGAEKTEGVLSLDLEHGAFDAGFLPITDVENLDGEILALRPARVHAHEHLRPILRLRAARSGGDLHLRIAKVVVPLQERLQLEGVGLVADGERLPVDFGDHLRVGIGVEQLVHLNRALRARPELVERVNPDAERLDLLHHLLRTLLVVPERALGHLAFVRDQRVTLAVEVKETSAVPRGGQRPASAISRVRTRPWDSQEKDEPLPARRRTARPYRRKIPEPHPSFQCSLR